jgi:serine protease Do
MDNISNKVVRIISQKIEFDWNIPFKLNSISGSIGSGFFIDLKGHILTCSHVVDQSKKIMVQIPSIGKERFETDIIAHCPEFDLALLKIKGFKNTHYFKLGDSKKIKFGEDSIALGYPLGQDNIKITKGIISGKEDGDFQTDTPINPGNSGGPLIVKGKVIGINSSGYQDSQNVGYAKPIKLYNMIKKDMMNKKTVLVKRPSLGILYNYLNEDYMTLYNSKCKNGVLIHYIIEDSPIYKAGLREGHVLCSINNINIDNYAMSDKIWLKDKLNLYELTLELENNQKVTIEFFDGNKKLKKTFLFSYFSQYIEKKYPLYEKIDYLCIGGIILMNLTKNLIEKVIVNMKNEVNTKNILKYSEYHNQDSPKIIVTSILPNSIIFNLSVIKTYDIISHINDIKVLSLEDVRNSILKPLKKKKDLFIKFRTEDNHMSVFKVKDILINENNMTNTFKYQKDKIIEKLEKQI